MRMRTPHHHVTLVGVYSGQCLVTGLRNHFFGQGSTVRILRFVGVACLLSVVCSLLFLSLIVWGGMVSTPSAFGFGDSVRNALSTGSFTAGILGILCGTLWALELIVRRLIAEETSQTQSYRVKD